jgi:hypothetical protein
MRNEELVNSFNACFKRTTNKAPANPELIEEVERAREEKRLEAHATWQREGDKELDHLVEDLREVVEARVTQLGAEAMTAGSLPPKPRNKALPRFGPIEE